MARMTSPNWTYWVRTKAAKASGGSPPGSTQNDSNQAIAACVLAHESGFLDTHPASPVQAAHLSKWAAAWRPGIRYVETETAWFRVREAGSSDRTILLFADEPNAIEHHDEIFDPSDALLGAVQSTVGNSTRDERRGCDCDFDPSAAAGH